MGGELASGSLFEDPMRLGFGILSLVATVVASWRVVKIVNDTLYDPALPKEKSQDSRKSV